MIYSSTIKDKIKEIQVENFGNKIISNSESVFYAGSPSKVTIQIYLPDNIESVAFLGNSMVITYRTSTGTNVLSFTSEVDLEGTISATQGIKNIEIVAGDTKSYVNSV